MSDLKYLSRMSKVSFKYIMAGSLGAFIGLIIFGITNGVVSVFVDIHASEFLQIILTLIVPLGLACGIAIPYSAGKKRGLKRKCPKCGRLHGKTISSESKSVDYPKSYTETIRTATHYNAEGEYRGYSEVNGETVSYTETVAFRKWLLRCDGCHHKWFSDYEKK